MLQIAGDLTPVGKGERGSGPGSSYVSTKVTVVSAAAAIIAVLVVYMGTKAATMVATVALAALLMVLITFRSIVFQLKPFFPSLFSVVSSCLLLLAFFEDHMKMEPQYTGVRIEGDVVTLDFVKKMLDDFKNWKNLHKRESSAGMFLHDKNMEQPFRLNWTTFSMGNKRENKVVFASVIFLRNDADEALQKLNGTAIGKQTVCLLGDETHQINTYISLFLPSSFCLFAVASLKFIFGKRKESPYRRANA
ncbi:Serine/threonine-protein phosphatase 5 [Capsicum chinense]|nr:Serine/threonine-protein phosphatase 5 [Capsicum chinense]